MERAKGVCEQRARLVKDQLYVWVEVVGGEICACAGVDRWKEGRDGVDGIDIYVIMDCGRNV